MFSDGVVDMEAFIFLVLAILLAKTWVLYRIAVVTKGAGR